MARDPIGGTGGQRLQRRNFRRPASRTRMPDRRFRTTTPSGRTVSTRAPAPRQTRRRVQVRSQNDSLSEIANQQQVDIQTLVAANPGVQMVSPGVVLNVPQAAAPAEAVAPAATLPEITGLIPPTAPALGPNLTQTFGGPLGEGPGGVPIAPVQQADTGLDVASMMQSLGATDAGGQLTNIPQGIQQGERQVGAVMGARMGGVTTTPQTLGQEPERVFGAPTTSAFTSQGVPRADLTTAYAQDVSSAYRAWEAYLDGADVGDAWLDVFENYGWLEGDEGIVDYQGFHGYGGGYYPYGQMRYISGGGRGGYAYPRSSYAGTRRTSASRAFGLVNWRI